MTAAHAHWHTLFLARHPLPLRWLRLPLLLATVGLSCVCIAVGIQALDRSSKLESSIRDIAEDTGSTIVFDMNDIKATTIVLTLVGFLLAIISSVFSVSLAYDFIAHVRTRRDVAVAKECSVDEDEMGQNVQRLPFSTRTLRFQTISLSFLSVWLLAVLIPSTLFSRTGSAHLSIQNDSLPSMVFVDPVYWDYGFLRCLAAAPWFSLVFSAPASIVTWVAWKYSPPTPTA